MATTFVPIPRLAAKVPKENFDIRRNFFKGATLNVPARIMQITGNGRIFGTTKNKNTPTNIPVGRRIRVIREFDGLWIRDQWSDGVTGAFSIDNLNPDYKYTIIVYDHTLQYDPETRGPLSTVPMP